MLIADTGIHWHSQACDVRQILAWQKRKEEYLEYMYDKIFFVLWRFDARELCYNSGTSAFLCALKARRLKAERYSHDKEMRGDTTLVPWRSFTIRNQRNKIMSKPDAPKFVIALFSFKGKNNDEVCKKKRIPLIEWYLRISYNISEQYIIVISKICFF